MRTLLLVTTVALAAGCGAHQTQLGRGASTLDRPVFEKTKSRRLWGLVGDKPSIDLAALAASCPHGDALVEERGSILNYTVIGLFAHRTTLVVYCRDDAYRAARQEELRRQQAEMAAFVARVDAESAADHARWDQARSTGAPADAPPPDAPVPDAPAHVGAGGGASAPGWTDADVRVDRRTVSTAQAVATTHEQCDAMIPPAEADDPWNANVLTQHKREPCHRCVEGGKRFSIYGLRPLQSSCD